MEDSNCLFSNTNHFASLNNMRLSGKMCDVTIKVDNKEFQAHKTILAASLKYFESMFLNSFQESKQNVITMRDIEAKDLETIISFAYTGKILLSASNALGLLEVANYLNEDVIKEASMNFLLKNLKKEDACCAYKFANTIIGSVSLKTASRSAILLHFEFCSQTAEYLNFDFECLKDVLSSANLDSQEFRKCLFKGVLRWIMHDGSRQIYINDLLNILQISKLNLDFLFDYLCNYIQNQNYNGIVKDIMLFYHEKRRDIQQTETLKKSLIILRIHNYRLQTQFFDFTTKKWCGLSNIAYSSNCWICQSVMLRDMLYYTTYDSSTGNTLNVFNPATKENTTLPSDSRLLSCTTIHACTDLLYFFGGIRAYLQSNQVLKYDPSTKSFENLAPMENNRSNAAAILYQGSLLVLGGKNNGGYMNSVEKYDLDTKKWTDFPAMYESRGYHAVAALDGKLYACGGRGYSSNGSLNSVEVYDQSKKCWQLIASMNKRRYNSLVVAHVGKLLAIGGDIDSRKTVEIYDPLTNKWQIDEEYSRGLEISDPHGGLISSSYAN